MYVCVCVRAQEREEGTIIMCVRVYVQEREEGTIIMCVCVYVCEERMGRKGGGETVIVWSKLIAPYENKCCVSVSNPSHSDFSLSLLI